MRKKLRQLLSLGWLLLLGSSVCLAQYTTVNATVVDSTSQVWANAPYSWSFQPGPNQSNPANYTYNGSPLTSFQGSGAANGSGVIAISGAIYDVTLIRPVGASYNINVCPNASTNCSTINFSPSGSSISLSTQINAAIIAPSFKAVSGSYGYNDAEAIPQLRPGSTYWNTISSVQRCYTGSAWGACSTGGGGSSAPFPEAPASSVFIGNGDSLINGVGLSAGQDIVTQISEQSYFTLVPSGNFHNLGVNGETLATMVTNYAADVHPYCAAATSSSPVFLLQEGGINDIQGNASAATIEGYLTTLWGEAKSDGCTLIGSTITPYTSRTGQATGLAPPYEAIREAVNKWIVSNIGAYGLLMDFNALLPHSSDTTWYQSDGIHWTAVANVRNASQFNSLISSRGGPQQTANFPQSFDCQPGISGGTSALTAATYKLYCQNTTGYSVLITSLQCMADNGSNASTSEASALSNGDIYSGDATPLVCGSSNTWATDTNVGASEIYNLLPGDTLVFSVITDGSSKNITVLGHGVVN